MMTSQEHRTANIWAYIETCLKHLQSLPDLEKRLSEKTSDSGSLHERFEDYLKGLDHFIHSARKIQLLMTQASANDGFQHLEQRSISAWREKISPGLKLYEQVYIDFMDRLGVEFRRHDKPFAGALVALSDMIDNGDLEIFDEDQRQAFNQIYEMDWFNPDEWLLGFEELNPILADGIDKKLNEQLRQRLREIYRNYAIGNYFSVFALARSVLEISLKDRAHTLNANKDQKLSSLKNQKLSDLIDDFSKAHPKINVHMGIIKESGDDTLHNIKFKQNPYKPESRRISAKNTIESLRIVLEYLNNCRK